jgi:hypothetical protein
VSVGICAGDDVCFWCAIANHHCVNFGGGLRLATFGCIPSHSAGVASGYEERLSVDQVARDNSAKLADWRANWSTNA